MFHWVDETFRFFMASIKVLFFVLSFLSSILKNKSVNTSQYLQEQYNYHVLKIYRKLCDTSRQLEKSKLDRIFLVKSKT